MRQVSMLDLHAEYELIRDKVRGVVDEVLESQRFIGGPAIERFERTMAKRAGVAHGLAVSSGTDALICALMALEIGPGDEVILPSFTFFATAGAVVRVGATPVFVDIDPQTFNLDPDKIEAALSKNTKAIIAVHLFGQCADMDAINAVAKSHGLAVVEDAAQAIDATYRGRFAGALGDMGCFSFYPTKNLGGFGEGGLILTNDERLYVLAKQLRNHGEAQRYVHERVGGNFRLDTMKAAILLVKLDLLGEFTQRRRHNAARYDELLDGAPLTTPHVAPELQHVYHQYSILCDRRDELATFVRERGVGSGVYYQIPLHRQPCFASLGYVEGSLPVSEDVASRILSLPCHPMLTEDDTEYVASCVHECFNTAPAVDRAKQKVARS